MMHEKALHLGKKAYALRVIYCTKKYIKKKLKFIWKENYPFLLLHISQSTLLTLILHMIFAYGLYPGTENEI